MAAVVGTGLPEILSTRKHRKRHLVLAMIAVRILDPCSNLTTAQKLHSDTFSDLLGGVLAVQVQRIPNFTPQEVRRRPSLWRRSISSANGQLAGRWGRGETATLPIHKCWKKTGESLAGLTKGIIAHHEQNAMYPGYDWLKSILIDSQAQFSYSEMVPLAPSS